LRCPRPLGSPSLWQPQPGRAGRSLRPPVPSLPELAVTALDPRNRASLLCEPAVPADILVIIAGAALLFLGVLRWALTLRQDRAPRHLGREADADLVRPPRPAASRGTAPAPGVLRLGRSPRRNRSHPHRRRHRLAGGGGAMNDFLRRLLFLPEQASSVAREID